MSDKSNYNHDVLLPVYNGESHIDETISNILSQSLCNIRLVISDNASIDSTYEIIKRYEGDDRVLIVRHEENIGMFGNWNFLLENVEAPTFTLISHDDLFSSDYVIKNALDTLYSSPDLSVVFSDIQYIDSNGKAIGGRAFKRTGRFSAEKWALKSIISCRNQFGLPIVVKAKAIKNIKFDENLKYAADLGFAIDVSYCMGGPAHVSEKLFLYRLHANNATLSAQKHAFKDMNIIRAKHDIELSYFERWQQFFYFYFYRFARVLALKLMSFS
jgi:glycosyltransferase involved in cell wall biosynthesis